MNSYDEEAQSAKHDRDAEREYRYLKHGCDRTDEQIERFQSPLDKRRAR